AFACGAAKILTEKVKSGLNTVKDNPEAIQLVAGVSAWTVGFTTGIKIAAGVTAGGAGAAAIAMAAGAILALDAAHSYVNDKPSLLEKLVNPKELPKDMKNIIKNTISKGRE
ncbi:MAG: hypothetical protein KAJ75_02850, partial [Alphaproteobacteria bacterium]|nr:hypothetical protein [Alphaproteobacteria bacterium]